MAYGQVTNDEAYLLASTNLSSILSYVMGLKTVSWRTVTLAFFLL